MIISIVSLLYLTTCSLLYLTTCQFNQSMFETSDAKRHPL